MKNIFLFIIYCFGFYACNPASNKIEREGEPAIYSLEDTDQAMNAAIRKAVQTIDTFKIALASKNENYSFFLLKKRFKTSSGGEHIWLSGINLKDGNFYGIIDNEPESTTEVEFGDTVEVSPAEISDWMYLDNGIVKGAYTIRVLRDRMSKKEQDLFDAETGLTFE